MFGQKKKLVMCQACRALVDPSEKVCPMCGNQSVPEVRARVSGDSRIFFSMLILGINVLVFILMGVVGLKNGGGAESFISSASGSVLRDFGSLAPDLVRQGEWWRIVTANFLHIGLIHLLFNSYALYQIGPMAEEIYGEQKFIFIYILTGIVAFTASFIFGIPSAGASGAISGLIGLLAAYGYKQGGTFGKALMRSMLTWMGMTIVMGFMIGANNVAHVGGFIAGGALAFVLKGEHPAMARAASVWNALAVISVLIIISSFVLVGKNYGAAQEQAAKEPIKSMQARKVIALHTAVEAADVALDDASNVTAKSSLNEVAKNLRRNAADISNIGQIDEPSDEIRNRIVTLMNKRADKLEKAAKSPSESTAISDEERNQYEMAFNDYKEWERSVLEKYDLYYTDEKK
jgi:rhomboid protease GluP